MFNFDTDGIVDLSLSEKVSIHLRQNFYPAIPETMVRPCIDAIHAVMADDEEAEIDLNGASYRGYGTAKAGVIFDAHRLWDVM